jgi:hypothetical protein
MALIGSFTVERIAPPHALQELPDQNGALPVVREQPLPPGTGLRGRSDEAVQEIVRSRTGGSKAWQFDPIQSDTPKICLFPAAEMEIRLQPGCGAKKILFRGISGDRRGDFGRPLCSPPLPEQQQRPECKHRCEDERGFGGGCRGRFGCLFSARGLFYRSRSGG